MRARSDLDARRLTYTREANRQVLDAGDEVRAQPRDVPNGLDLRHALRELFEHHFDLETREVEPEAEVLSVPEGDVRFRDVVPPDVECEWIREHVFVPVRGDVPDADLVPRLQLRPAELEVLR